MTLTPLSVRVRATEGDEQRWSSAWLRLLPARFPIGTWSSDLSAAGDAAFARRLGIDLCAGSADREATERLYERFFIQSLVHYGAPTPNRLQRHAGNPGLAAWLVADEPEFGLGSGASPMIYDRNQAFWNNPPAHPTYLNLATAGAFNEYGFIPDIIAMDHYAMYSAPNLLPGTWLFRNADMEEALVYTQLLKRNTEPARMWSWCQFASSSWGVQPEPWGVLHQFWSHILGGAKGVQFFRYAPGDEADSRWTATTNAVLDAVKMLNQVRTLCLYGEALDNVDVGDLPVLAGSLVSEHAMVVIVVNNNYSIERVNWVPVYSLSPVQGAVAVSLPDWISSPTIHQITPAGLAAAAFQWEGRRAVLSIEITDAPAVYLIGAPDHTAPQPPGGLNFAQYEASGAFTLSWQAPYDNFGAARYSVYRDDAPIAETPWPVYEGTNADHPMAEYRIVAVDAAGNASLPGPAARYGHYRFETNDYLEGWRALNNVVHEVADGALTLHPAGAQPSLQGPATPLDAAYCRYVRLRLRNSSTASQGRVFWRVGDAVWEEASSAALPLPADGARFVSVETPLYDQAGWTGVIDQLRIDFGDSAVDGTLAVDMIQLTPFSLDGDADNDGLSDREELDDYNTDPYRADSDGDGLNDGEEVLLFDTDPLNPDTDGDGMSDSDEVRYGSDPLDPNDRAPLPLSGTPIAAVAFAATAVALLHWRRAPIN